MALAGTLCGWFGHAWGGAVAAHPLRRCSGQLRRCFGYLWGAWWRLALCLNASQPPWVEICSGAASAHCRFSTLVRFPGACWWFAELLVPFSGHLSPTNSPLDVLFVAVFRQVPVPAPALCIAGRRGRFPPFGRGGCLDYANMGLPVHFYSLLRGVLHTAWTMLVLPTYAVLHGFAS